MKRVELLVRRFARDEDGAALLEYGMLVLLIAALCIIAARSLGSKVSTGFATANEQLP